MFFPHHKPFNFQMLRLANHIATGGAELNHLIRVAGEIPEPSPDGWYESWNRIAKEEHAAADAALERGATHSAHAAYLRAANYARVSTFYLSAERPEKRASNVASREAFAAGQRLSTDLVVNVTVPWREGPLPGYVLLPRHAPNGAAIVFIGGADATKEELYFTGGKRLVDRGFTVLSFDGPGQGESWLMKGFRAAPDWDLLGPGIVEVLTQFPSVDPGRVGLLGISMAGYYAPKVAAAEPRFKCVAVWGACFDVLEDLYDYYPTIQRHLQEIAGRDAAAARDFYSAFNLRQASRRIECPVLITHGTIDPVTSPKSAEKFAAAVGSRGELRMYEGGSHCMYNMPTVSQPPMFDWLAEKLGVAARP